LYRDSTGLKTDHSCDRFKQISITVETRRECNLQAFKVLSVESASVGPALVVCLSRVRSANNPKSAR